MKVVGIAGGSGTGKSTIAAHLVAGGGVHVDADQLGHDLLAADPEVTAAVRGRFGEAVVGADGAVDRRALGRVVFADAEARAALEAILHPRIVRRCAELVAEAARRGEALVVIDAALLLDVTVPFAFDLVIALRCDERTRMRRIMAKGGWSEREVRGRLASQAGIEKSFYKADVVVDTGGELGDVLARVDRLVGEASAGRRPGTNGKDES